MATLVYPKATWRGNGVSGGGFIGVPTKVVLHTTETEGMPSYNAGSYAPHLTFDPRDNSWTQHTSLNVAARSLRNLSGGVETNRANAIQIEIICYSNNPLAKAKYGRTWVGNLTPQNLAAIRAFIEWIGVPLVWPERAAHSYAEANEPGFRFTSNQWYTFNGVCGHQHVPENDHWNPGALDWEALLGSMGSEDLPMYPIKLKDGMATGRPEKAEDVRNIQAKLVAAGVSVNIDGTANQAFLDKVFALVGSPAGGSFISGEEGAALDIYLMQTMASPRDRKARQEAARAHERLDGLQIVG